MRLLDGRARFVVRSERVSVLHRVRRTLRKAFAMTRNTQACMACRIDNHLHDVCIQERIQQRSPALPAVTGLFQIRDCAAHRHRRRKTTLVGSTFCAGDDTTSQKRQQIPTRRRGTASQANLTTRHEPRERPNRRSGTASPADKHTQSTRRNRQIRLRNTNGASEQQQHRAEQQERTTREGGAESRTAHKQEVGRTTTAMRLWGREN